MSRFVDRAATDVITLANGDKVWVRQKLTAREQAALDGKLIRFEMDMSESDEKAVMRPRMVSGDWHEQKIEVCRAYIIDWDFKDDAGNVMTYSPEAFESLDDETIQEIAVAIDNLRAAHREAAEKKAPQLSGK